MNEKQFGALMRAAIGEETMQPWVTSAVRDRLSTAPAKPMRLPWLIAAAVVLIAMSAVLIPQLTSPRITPVPIPASSPTPSPAVVDPFNCRLPVGVAPGQLGFVDTRTGEFTRDATAPATSFEADPGALSPESYSPAAHVWVPAHATQMSPDGRTYASTRGKELHIIDAASGADRTLWTGSADLLFEWWGTDGIEVAEESPSLQGGRTWLVDPVTGSAVAAQPPRWLTPLWTDPRGVGFRPLGMDAQGRYIWWLRAVDRPGVDWVFYETAPGQRIYIYKGTEGDARGFDPGVAFADGTGIWFNDFSHSALWHWSPDGGLHKIVVAGLPASAILNPAGPCF